MQLDYFMLKKIFKSKNFFQFCRFCIVGSIGTGIDFAVLNLGILVFSWNVYLTATLAFVLAASNNFLLNKYWTFSEKSKGSRFVSQYMQFLLVSIGGLLLNLGIMYFLIEGAGLWYNWAKAFAVLIVVMWNFGLNKAWTFRSANVKVINEIENN